MFCPLIASPRPAARTERPCLPATSQNGNDGGACQASTPRIRNWLPAPVSASDTPSSFPQSNPVPSGPTSFPAGLQMGSPESPARGNASAGPREAWALRVCRHRGACRLRNIRRSPHRSTLLLECSRRLQSRESASGAFIEEQPDRFLDELQRLLVWLSVRVGN